MLQSFRDNLKGVTAAIVVGLLIIPFAFFGVQSLFVSGSSVEEAVNVNGAKISRLEVDRGVEFQKQRILSQLENVDPKLLDDERLRGPVIEQLIRQKLLTLTAEENGMTISNKTFNEIVFANQAFQENGRFDNNLYQYHLGRLGFTPRTYRETVMSELLANQLSAGIQASAFSDVAQVEDFSRLALQERSFDYLLLNRNTIAEVNVTSEEVSEYYNSHQDQFTEPDKVVVEYIELTPQLLGPAVEVSESRVDERLALEQKKIEEEGKSWRLAHILIDPKANPDYKQTIEKIEQRLAAKDDFSVLAKEYSADFGSAEQGGELGTFTEDSLPAGFEGAIANLQTGEVSEPVELESGIHIIKVLEKSDIAEGVKPPTRQEVIAKLKNELAVEKLPVKLEQLKEETFSVDSLASAAEVIELPVRVSEPFSREGGTGIARFPAVAKAAFSEEVFKEGYASEVLEVGENHFVVIKLKDFTPTHLSPLDKVTDQIKEIVTTQKVQSALHERGVEMFGALKAGESLNEIAQKESLEIKAEEDVTRFDNRVPQFLAEAVFQPPTSSELPFYGMTSASNGDLYLYEIKKIQPGNLQEIPDAERNAMKSSLRQLNASREYVAYLDALEDSAEIKRGAGVAPNSQ